MSQEVKNNHPFEPLRWDDVDNDTLQTYKTFVDEMPSLPIHVQKLLKIISDENSNAEDIAKIASSDPAMVSKILKAINSTYYGLSKPTSNLHLAIVLLGFNEVRKIALQAGLSGMFSETWAYKGYDTSGLWKHSYLTSVCAEEICRRIAPKRAGELLTMGILHDIGKYALFRMTVLIKQKGIATIKSNTPPSTGTLLEKEEAIFSINHPIIGGMLAEKWDLPPNVRAVIEHHHHPSFWSSDSIPENILKDTAIVSVSNAIVNTVIKTKEEIMIPRPEYFEVLGMKPSLEAAITDELQEKIKQAEKFIMIIRE